MTWNDSVEVNKRRFGIKWERRRMIQNKSFEEVKCRNKISPQWTPHQPNLRGQFEVLSRFTPFSVGKKSSSVQGTSGLSYRWEAVGFTAGHRSSLTDTDLTYAAELHLTWRCWPAAKQWSGLICRITQVKTTKSAASNSCKELQWFQIHVLCK